MGIKIINPKELPAIVLDRLHLDQLIIKVNRETREYIIRATGVIYGIDQDGKRVYSNDIRTINDDTFLATSIQKAIEVGQATSPEDFLAQVETARIAKNSKTTSYAEALVDIEAGVQKIFEIAGSVDIGELISG